MAELAYPIDHPAHPDNVGKKMPARFTDRNFDYPANHPARGGQGQAVPIAAGSTHPRDGHKHLHGVGGKTLIEAEREFSRLPEEEQAARLKWNKEGIPAEPEEE
jgi:hypothetical protein